MSRIKSKNTKPEILVRQFLHSKGYRFRIHDEKLPGKPDVVLPKHRVVVFIHGCFWHGHKGCKYFIIPRTRTKWWTEKIKSNHQRDFNNYSKLKQDKWKVVTIFECELKPGKRDKTFKNLLKRWLYGTLKLEKN